MSEKNARDRVDAEAKRLASILEADQECKGALCDETNTKVKRAIHVTAGVCAAVAIQPLPFADILVLTPIQVTLAYKIARLRGQQVSQEQAKRVLAELSGVIGLGLLAQQTALGLYKIGLPGLGGFMTIPLVYGLTYGIGRVIDYYYICLAQGLSFDAKEAKKIFKSAKKEGKSAGRKEGKKS